MRLLLGAVISVGLASSTTASLLPWVHRQPAGLTPAKETFAPGQDESNFSPAPTPAPAGSEAFLELAKRQTVGSGTCGYLSGSLGTWPEFEKAGLD
jgi:hypothetical protein